MSTQINNNLFKRQVFELMLKKGSADTPSKIDGANCNGAVLLMELGQANSTDQFAVETEENRGKLLSISVTSLNH